MTKRDSGKETKRSKSSAAKTMPKRASIREALQDAQSKIKTAEAELEALRQQWGLTSRLTLTGQIDDPLSEGLFAASDVVCQLSRWEEVFGYVNAEAMACSRPLIGTRVGGIPEIIQDGITDVSEGDRFAGLL